MVSSFLSKPIHSVALFSYTHFKVLYEKISFDRNDDMYLCGIRTGGFCSHGYIKKNEDSFFLVIGTKTCGYFLQNNVGKNCCLYELRRRRVFDSCFINK